MRIVAFGMAATLLAGGCVYVDENEGEGEDGAAGGGLPAFATQKDRPQLALLEHVLAGYFASDITNPPTVCASVHDGRSEVALRPDEETALMARFPSLAPLVRCTQADGRWQDAETGEPALVFNLHSFTCASSEACSGWAGYQAGGAASMSYRYTMDWLAGEWTFARDPRIIAEQ